MIPADPPRGAVGLPRAMRALRHRDFRLIWLGQVARGTSQWMQVTTVPLYVLRVGGGAVELGIVAALQFVPVLVLAPLGGAAADRFPKRAILIVAQVVLAAEALALAVSTLTASSVLMPIYILSLIFGVANAVEMPFRQTFVAELLPASDLLNGIALNQGAFQVTRIAAPAIAGVIVQVAGITPNFIIGAACSLAAVGLLVAIRSSPQRMAVSTDLSLRGQLGAGLRHARELTAVRWGLLLLGGCAFFGLSQQTLLPLYATDSIGGDARTYGAMLAAMGVGALAAALPATLAGRRDAISRMTAGALSLAVILFLMALTTQPDLALVLMVGLGFFFVLTVGSVNQVIQADVDHAMRGRVMGIYLSVHLGGVALGGLAAGALAELTSVPLMMMVGAVSTAVMAVVVRLRVRGLGVESPPD